MHHETDMAQEVTFIDSESPLCELIENIKQEKRIAIDTEADSLHHYFEKVCLIQLNVGGRLFIVDPLCSMDLSAFFKVLSQRLIIMHGADYDLRLLYKGYGFEPSEVFDTMIAVKVLGYENLGLQNQIMYHFGIHISKSGQKMDWSRRPLLQKMIVYAANDVKYLLLLHEKIEKELIELDRVEWLKQSCRKLISKASTLTYKDPREEWRIKGSFSLGGREMAIVRELWYWRDKEAQKADIPSFKIITDENILDIALWAAEDSHILLRQYPSLPKTCTGRRYPGLERAYKRAISLQPEKWPRPLKGKPGIKRTIDGNLLSSLKKKRDSIALELKLSPPLLASQKSLSAIAVLRPKTVEEFNELSKLQTWQVEILAEAFLDELRKFEEKNSAKK